MIKESTRKLIAEINQYDVLANVGGDVPLAYTKVPSWEKALIAAETQKWESLNNALRNRLTFHSSIKRIAAAREWNKKAPEINELLAPAMTKVYAYFEKKKFSWHFGSDVIFQFSGAIEEEEMNDVIKPLFFQSVLLPVYRSGHYACGWDGRGVTKREEQTGQIDSLPSGKLMVY